MKSLLCLASAFLLLLPAWADDKATMDGTWEMSKGEMDGKPIPDELLKSIKLTIKGNEYEVSVMGQTIKGTSTADDTPTQKRVKLKDKDGPNADKTVYAIYEIKKDEMKVCYAMEGTEYPKEFKAPEGSKLFNVVYKRVK